MSRPLAAATLPSTLRNQLDTRLRASAFGQLEDHVAWLAEGGTKLSKSALGRYAIALRRHDARAGRDGAAFLEENKAQRASKAPRRLSQVLDELARLQARQSALLKELEKLVATPNIVGRQKKIVTPPPT